MSTLMEQLKALTAVTANNDAATYRDLVARANDPKKGDAALLRDVLNRLGLTADDFAGDVAAVEEFEALGEYLLPAEKLQDVRDVFTLWDEGERKKLAEIDARRAAALTRLSDMVNRSGPVPNGEIETAEDVGAAMRKAEFELREAQISYQVELGKKMAERDRIIQGHNTAYNRRCELAADHPRVIHGHIARKAATLDYVPSERRVSAERAPAPYTGTMAAPLSADPDDSRSVVGGSNIR